MSEQAAETVPESVLTELDVGMARDEHAARKWQAQADAYQRYADDTRGHMAKLAAVREYMAERVGRPWDEVRAGLCADLAKAEADLAGAGAELHAAREAERDCIGAVRWMQRRRDELLAGSGQPEEER